MRRTPTHPGEILREEFMPDYGLSVATLAKRLGVSRQSVNEVVRERRAVSTETAMRLGRLFGTSAEYWLNLQRTSTSGSRSTCTVKSSMPSRP